MLLNIIIKIFSVLYGFINTNNRNLKHCLHLFCIIIDTIGFYLSFKYYNHLSDYNP